MAAIARARADGYLSRALAAARAEKARCDGPAIRRTIAEILADLGLDADAISAWNVYGAGGTAAGTEARAAIAELRRRPSPIVEVPAERRTEALTLYRGATDLRLQGQHDRAIALFRRSYALAPHPLTVVQIGFAHQDAGRPAAARTAFERALAIAEWRAGKPAEARRVRGHSAAVVDAVFSPDGRTVATASFDKTVKLWDAGTGREVRTLAAEHDDNLTAIAYSTDGRMLAVGEFKGRIHIWDPATGAELHTFTHDRQVSALAFSPDGTLIASASWDVGDQVVVRELATGAIRHRLAVGDMPATAIGFSRDGRLLAAGGTGVTFLWDAATGRQLHSLTGQDGIIHDLAFSAGGLLATASRKGTVRIWSAEDGRSVRTFTLAGPGLSVAFSPDDRLIAYTDGESGRLASAATGEPVLDLAESEAALASIAFSSDGSRLVTAGGKATEATLWDAASGRLLRVLGPRPIGLHALSFAGDGARLATGDDDGTIRVWELGGRPPWSPGAHDDVVRTLEFAPDASHLLSGGHDHRLRMWDLSGRTQRWEVDTGGPVFDATFAPGGERIAVAGKGVQLRRVDTGAAIDVRLGSDQIFAVAYRPDGALAAAATGRRLHQWSATGAPAPERTLQARVLAWSPDGETLAAGGDDGTISLWPATGEGTAVEMARHWWTVLALAFRPDGKRLVSTGDQSVRVWDPKTQAHLMELTGHTHTALAAAFRRDGGLLATAAADGTVLLWDGQSFSLLATLLAADDGRWAVFTPAGDVDGSTEPDGSSLVYWQVGDLQLPGIVGWPRAHRPGLLGRYGATRATL
jgi:WD40 repeat protein